MTISGSSARGRFLLRLAPGLLVLLALGGCKSAGRQDPILELSAAESLAKGKELLGAEKPAQARPYLTHAFEVEPNSLAGREGLLLAADSYYLEGGRVNLIQAEQRYKDFLNRFPTSDKAAYVQFQMANALAGRIGRADRDLEASRKALAAYEDLLNLYPTSEYAREARGKILVVKDSLAEHELGVGDFYLRFGMPLAAAKRYEYLLGNYPEYSKKETALYQLGVAHVQSGKREEAEKAFARLSREFPDSAFLGKLPELPPAPPAETPAPTGQGAPSR